MDEGFFFFFFFLFVVSPRLYKVSMVGEVSFFFFLNYHFATGFLGWVEFDFLLRLVIFFFFLVSTVGEVFLFFVFFVF